MMTEIDVTFTEIHQAIIKQGPCAFCGAKYAAHRVVDAQMERVAAGDHIESVAEDHDITVQEMVSFWLALRELEQDERRTTDR